MIMPTTTLLPLESDAQGVFRVSGTRIPFDNILHEFLAGASPEEIVSSYPTISLATVYTLIGHYLGNPAEWNAYIWKNETATDSAIRAGQLRQQGLRERLIANLNSPEASGASVSR